MSKNKIITVFIVLFILLVGLSATSANDNTTTDKPIITAHESDTSIVSENSINTPKQEYKKTLNKESKEIKQVPANKTQLTMEADNITCNWGETATLNTSLYTADTHQQVYPTEGVVMTFVDNDIISTHNLSHASMETYYDTTQLDPGVYDLYYQYTASLVYETVESYNTLTINHQYEVTTPTVNLNYSAKTGTCTPLTLECEDYYGYGDIEVYIDGQLVDTVTDVDYDQYTVNIDDLIDPQVKQYYDWMLRFNPYIDTITVNTLSGTINCKDYPLTITTPEDRITADVGDVVTIEFTFNDTVSDGSVSVGYGSSFDNTTYISSGVNSITFNTTGYMQGEYPLNITYHDSNIYDQTSTTLTLELYQPTTITADNEELNITIGEDNTYTVNFETSLDAWNDVIWGSIDVYIDDMVIDTIAVDDESTNTISFILDDYNMEALTPGEHTLRAVFTSDDAYIRQSSTTVTLNINGDLTISLPENITTNTQNTITIPVNVTFNNQKITSGTLTILINNTQAGSIDLSTQQTTIQLENNYNPGIYTLKAQYNDPSNTYPSQTNNTTLIIQSNTTIQTSILNDTIKNSTINILLVDDRENSFEGLVNITNPDGSTTQNIQIPSTGLNITYAGLTKGENTFTISYPGNEVYKAKKANITVNVVLLNSTTTATITNNTIDNTTIKVEVVDEKTGTPVNGGKVEIINTANNLVVGNATIDANGQAIITTNINTMGTYNLKVEYKGNDEYNASTTQVSSITVVKRESELTTTINNDTLSNTSITITLNDPATDTPIANAPITVTLPDGTQINTHTDNNGQANITPNIPVGENTIVINYPGSEKYNSTNQEVTINIKQRQSQINATITNNTIRNTTISATITDKTTGNPVTSGTVNVIDATNDNIIATATLNGSNTVTLTTNIDTMGTYNLKVEYAGNTNYTPSTTTLEDVNVVKRESKIEAQVNNNTQGDTSITITLTDPITDTPITNMPITITLPNGTTIDAVTDENGSATITPDLPVGENTITIIYPVNDEYNTTSITETINITPRQSITIATLNNNTLSNTSITVTIRDKTTGNPVTSGNITITNTANNEVIARGTLDGSNTINLPLNINTAGEYNLQVTYHGNQNYTTSNTTLNDITIVKRAATIEIKTLNDTVEDTRVNITVKDPVTGTPIANAPITVTLPDGTQLNTHTGSTGTTTVTLDLAADIQTITVTYDGSNTYNTTTTTYTLNIEKLESTITVTQKTGYIGENITLTATITDKEAKPINGGRVIFKLNGITLKYDNGETIYADVTGGKASISYYIPCNYQAKTYKLEAVYTGNENYTSSRSNTPLVNLKQRQAQLTISTNNSIKVDQTLTININITDKRDPTRQVNGYVILKIDGLTLKDANDEAIQVAITNNTASYNYTIGHEYSARKHTITAVLVNNTYVRSQENTTFNVTQTTAQIQLNTPKLNNNQVQVTGQIQDEAGHTLTGTNTALVKINGQTLKTSNGDPQYYQIQDGQINITLPEYNYKDDTYQIEVVTGQRNAFTGARNTTTLTITDKKNIKTATMTNKQLVNIIPEKTIATTDENNAITIKVKDTTNKNIQKGTITYTSNGINIAKTQVKNGQATLNQKITKPGKYNITATYTDNTGTYQDTTKQFTIQIIKPTQTKTTITADNTKATVGESLTYTSFFTDQYQNKIKNQTAKITINNRTTTHQVKDGITTTTITLNKTGTYTITITSNEAKITRTITVTKKTPKLTITTKKLTAGQKNNLTVQVTTKDNVPLNEGKIQWKINGITLKNNDNSSIQTTVKDGTSTLSYTIPTRWAGKEVNITVVYTGSNNYTAQKTNTRINIPQLQAQAKTTLPTQIHTKDNITITTAITDKNTRKAVPDQKIAVKINGKTIDTPRLRNGSAQINYKLPLLKTNKTHNLTIVYGNNNYQRLDATTTFRIQKINTTITLKNQTMKKGNTLHLKSIIKDIHQETMNRNDTICIKLNNKTIQITRLKNGVLDTIIPVNYKKGTYVLTIKLGDNYYYNGLTKNIKLTIT